MKHDTQFKIYTLTNLLIFIFDDITILIFETSTISIEYGKSESSISEHLFNRSS